MRAFRLLAALSAWTITASCSFEAQIGNALARYCTERCMGVYTDGPCAQCLTYDAGVRRDAGPTVMPDAGRDSGTPDAGRDAGPPDTGVADAGTFEAQVVAPLALPVTVDAVVFGGSGAGLPLRQLLTSSAAPWTVTLPAVPVSATVLRLDAPGAPSQFFYEGLSFVPSTRMVVAVTPDTLADGGIAVAVVPDLAQAEYVNALTERLRTVDVGDGGFSAQHQAGVTIGGRDPSDVVLEAFTDAGASAGFQIGFPLGAAGSDTYVLAGRWFAPLDDPTAARLYRVGTSNVAPIKQLVRVYAFDPADGGAPPSIGTRPFPTAPGSPLTLPLPLVSSSADGGRTVFFGNGAVTIPIQTGNSEYLAVAGANTAAPAAAPVRGSAPIVSVVNVSGRFINGVLLDAGALPTGDVRPGFMLLAWDAGLSFAGAETFVVPNDFFTGALVFVPGVDAGAPARPVLIDTLRTPWRVR